MIGEPSPWVEAWLGTPWIAGEKECWHFVVEVLEAQFGHRDLPLVGAGDDPRASRRLIAEHSERQAWAPVETPIEGDVVLLRRGAHPCHVGVWAAPNHVLHSIQGSGAILTATDRLGELGYKVAGVIRRAGNRANP